VGKADAMLARAKPLRCDTATAETDRFRNTELGLQQGRLLAATAEDGTTFAGRR
jgi:hypothetical protein